MRLTSARAMVRIVLAVLLWPITAHAVPIPYTLDFEVQYFRGPVDPRVTIGERYFGFFTVDNSILATDGLNKAGDVSSFFIKMEDVIWSSGFPFPVSEFAGFRGPSGPYSSSPGFDVVGGEITNLRGGVFGAADFPFVDFSADFREPPGACTGFNCPNSFWTINPLTTAAGGFGGSMLVNRVPEPTTLALLGIALAGLGFAFRRKLH